jgi:hypothetical protein
MPQLGDRVRYQRWNNTVGIGTVTSVFENYFITNRRAYHVQGNAENLTIIDDQILEVLTDD